MAYAIVGILVIAFVAVIILSAKNWHWANIVFLSLAFLAAIGVTIATSQVLDLRRTDMLAAQKFQRDLEAMEVQVETALYGSGLASEYGPDSLRGLSQALNLETAGQGRVWRSGVVESNGSNRLFKFSTARNSSPNAISMDNMHLFVYADAQIDDEIYPSRFVGTMRVVTDAPDSVDLEPLFIVDQQEYTTPSTTWTLFEKSPADVRDAFIRNSGIEIDPEDPALNEKLNQYRQLLVEQYMPASIFNFDLNDDEQARQYEYLIDRILFDGLPLNQIENWIDAQPDRIARRFDPPNEEVFVLFEFSEKSRVPYQVDSEGNVENDGQFTSGGYAVDPQLHAGRDIEFVKGDRILVDQLTADGYQRGDEPVSPFATNESVTEIHRVYVRQLSDFPYLLKTMQRQTAEYTAEIGRIELNNQKVLQAAADAEQQLRKRTEIAEKLAEDQAKLQADVDQVRQFAGQMQMKISEMTSKIDELVNGIKEDHRKIKALPRAIDTSTTKVSLDSHVANSE